VTRLHRVMSGGDGWSADGEQAVRLGDLPNIIQRPAAGRETLADILVRISLLTMHFERLLAELDINPLMVRPSGQG